MRWEQQVQYASQTDIGLRRKNNEDTVTARLAVDETEYDARGHLFLVADGMGGHAVGELASKSPPRPSRTRSSRFRRGRRPNC